MKFMNIKQTMRNKVRIAQTAYLYFLDMTFVKVLHMKFEALWNSQKMFTNTSVSSGTPKIFQERYVKDKYEFNVLLNVIS